MPKRDQIQHCCSRVIVLLTKRLRAAHPISKQKRWASSVSRESKRSNRAASFRLLCNYSDSKAQQLHPTIFGNPRDLFTLHQTQNTKWNHTENEMPTITTLSLDDVQKHPTELVRCLSFFFFFGSWGTAWFLSTMEAALGQHAVKSTADRLPYFTRVAVTEHDSIPEARSPPHTPHPPGPPRWKTDKKINKL